MNRQTFTSPLVVLLFGLLLTVQATPAQELALGTTATKLSGKPVQQKARTLEEALRQIEQQYQVRFSFSSRKAKESRLADYRFEQARTLEESLQTLLLPFELTFEKIKEGYYVITRKRRTSPLLNQTDPPDASPAAPPTSDAPAPDSQAQEDSGSQAPALAVTGKVTDQDGNGIPGVTVLLKGTTTGTTTSADGNYTLSVPDGQAGGVLVFSYIGYTTEEVPINNRSTVNVSLVQDTKALSEVVVIGYGTIKKENLTGAVSQIKAEALENRAITSVGEGLAGQLAGVQVQQTSGVPGAGLQIKIRGSNSINAGSQPLYVVDGIPMTDIEGLNQNDVESIEVLKDASSAAIYGARGAGGVVLVTTRKGKKGKPTFDFNAYYGLQKVDRIIDVMNTREYTAYGIWRNNAEYLRNGGDLNDPLEARAANFRYPESYLRPEELPDNNWQELIYRVAPMQNYQLTASGGGDMGNFLVSGAYLKQDGVIRHTGYERVNFRLNTSLNVGKKLTLGMNIAPSFATQNNPDSEGKESVVHHAQNMPPFVARNLNTEKWGYADSYGDVYANPLARLAEVYDETKDTRILTNVWGEVKIIEGLTFRSQYGYNVRQSRESYFKPANVNKGRLTFGEAEKRDWNDWSLQNTLTYSKIFNDTHDLSILLGQSAEKSDYHQLETRASGFPSDLVYTLNVASTPSQARTYESESALASFFGRVQYNFKDKYLFSASLRQDGSSKFGSDTKFGLFPSASVGWKIDRENFLSGVTWLSLLKVRAAWGKTGNDRIGNYDHLALMNINNYSLNGGIVSGLTPSTLGNAGLGWETTVTKDVGIDIGAFKNRLQLNLDYYQNDTRDLLLSVPVPYVSGYTSNRENIGAVQNRGWEAEVTSRNTTGRLLWETSFNIAHNVNEVKKMGEGDAPLIFPTWGKNGYITQVGHPIGSYYMLKADGLLMPEDFDDSGKPLVPIMNGQEPGNIKIVDVNGDGRITTADETIVGSNFPDFIWGLTNTVKFKNFDLRVLVQGSQGGEVFFLGARQLDTGGDSRNQFSRWLRSWKPPYEDGQNPIPQDHGVDMSWDGKTPNPFGNNPTYNDTWLYDASFIRLKNITLGYNLPVSLSNKVGIKRARIYVMSDNVYTWNRYPGATPESNSNGNNSTRPGTDYGTYPLSRRYNLGLNVTF